MPWQSCRPYRWASALTHATCATSSSPPAAQGGPRARCCSTTAPSTSCTSSTGPLTLAAGRRWHIRAAVPSLGLMPAGACAGARASCCRRRRRASIHPSWCAWPPARESDACAEAQFASGCALSLRAALAQEVFGALASGGSLAVVAPGGEKDTQHLARVCRRHAVTCLCLVPSQLEALLRVRPRLVGCCEAAGYQTADAERGHGVQEPDFRACASLRSVICGGEAMRAPLTKLFASLLPHARLYNDYGPTEATVASTGGRCPCACACRASCSAAAQPP